MELKHLKERVQKIEKYVKSGDMYLIDITFYDGCTVGIYLACGISHDDENVYFKRSRWEGNLDILKFSFKNIKSITWY